MAISAALSSQVKSVAELHVDLSRFRIVRATKGLAIIEKESPVHQIQSGDGNREPFRERFAE